MLDGIDSATSSLISTRGPEPERGGSTPTSSTWHHFYDAPMDSKRVFWDAWYRTCRGAMERTYRTHLRRLARERSDARSEPLIVTVVRRMARPAAGTIRAPPLQRVPDRAVVAWSLLAGKFLPERTVAVGHTHECSRPRLEFAQISPRRRP